MWPLSYLCKQEPQPYCHGLVSHRGRAQRCGMQLFACSCDWCFKIFPIVGHITQYSKPVWSIIISKHWAIGLSHYTANCWIRTEGAREISSGCKAKISYLWASTLKVFLKFSSCRIHWTSTNWYSLLLKCYCKKTGVILAKIRAKRRAKLKSCDFVVILWFKSPAIIWNKWFILRGNTSQGLHVD